VVLYIYTKDNELKISHYEKKEKGYMIGSREFNTITSNKLRANIKSQKLL
jgi:hypothetical protein